MKYAIRTAVVCVVGLTLATSAWAQWSSDPSQNLALSNIAGADQVQPKLLPLPNDSWYVSWFNNNPNDPPPNGYDVYYQLLNANGVEQFPHDGVQVAKLTSVRPRTTVSQSTPPAMHCWRFSTIAAIPTIRR